MLKIKLFPKGKKHQRTFRIVVSEQRSKFNGNFIEDIGFFNPQLKAVEIDKDKLTKWIKNGAQITLGVDKLINPDKHPRIKKVKPEVKTEPKPEVKTEATTEIPVTAN